MLVKSTPSATRKEANMSAFSRRQNYSRVVIPERRHDEERRVLLRRLGIGATVLTIVVGGYAFAAAVYALFGPDDAGDAPIFQPILWILRILG